MFGIFRPVLIWPQRLSERLKDEHIEAILAHELGHAQRRDNLTALLHMVVEAAFWFHPLVWWMERRMVEERERACDEAVVQMGSRPGIYAESLLKACRFCVESPLVCVSGITGADLSKRVLSIMTLRLEQMSMGKKIALALFGVLVIATPILLGQSEAAQRVMLAVVNAAPSPFRTAAHAMIAQVPTPSTGLIAEVQANTAVPNAEQATAQPEVRYGMGESWIPQPDAPAVITSGNFSRSRDDTGRNDLLVGARIDSKSNDDIVFFRMGWVYVLPSGLEFDKGETVVPYNGLHPGGTFGVPEWHVPQRSDATAFLFFLEEIALDHGTRWEVDHKQIEAYIAAHPVNGGGTPTGEVGATNAVPVRIAYAQQAGAATGGASGAVAGVKFEVATIKPHDPKAMFTMTPPGSKQIMDMMSSTRGLVAQAYGVSTLERVEGGPDWMDKDIYQVEGKIPDEVFAAMQMMTGSERYDQALLIMQSLLVERFQLKAHMETRERPVWELTIAKGGAKLPPPNPPPADGTAVAAQMSGSWVATKDGVRIRNSTLDGMLYAPWFGLRGRPIVNKTGLTGNYNLTLNWVPDIPGQSGPNLPLAAPEGQASIFTALDEQLGLKLESTKAPVDVLVIDHIERPSAN